MKKFLVAIILFAVPAFGADPFHYRCQATEGNDREAQICVLLVESFIEADFTEAWHDGAYSWYGVSIIPQQHSDGIGVSASVDVDYYTKCCGQMLISVSQNIILIETEEYYSKEWVNGFVKSIESSIETWEVNVTPEIAAHCNQNRSILAGLEE